MEKNACKYLDVIGVFLILIAIVLLIYCSVFESFESMVLGMIFGIIGIILVRLSEKINDESALLSVILLLLSVITAIVNAPTIITEAVIIICGIGIILFALKPPEDSPVCKSAAKQ